MIPGVVDEDPSVVLAPVLNIPSSNPTSFDREESPQGNSVIYNSSFMSLFHEK